MDVDLAVIPIETSGSFHENIHFPFDILLPFFYYPLLSFTIPHYHWIDIRWQTHPFGFLSPDPCHRVFEKVNRSWKPVGTAFLNEKSILFRMYVNLHSF